VANGYLRIVSGGLDGDGAKVAENWDHLGMEKVTMQPLA
jgi:hypothetical protein